MKWSKVKNALVSAYIVFSIVTVGFIGFLVFEDLENDVCVEAASTWTQTSDTEFNNGTNDNVSVIGIGSAAELIINNQNNWTRKYTSSSPSSRCDYRMASSNDSHSVLLFGGQHKIGEDNETWIYNIDTETWNQKTLSLKPTARTYFDMASVYNNDKVVLFGGYSLSPFLIGNDTWVYDFGDNTWTQKIQAVTPAKRFYHSMASIYGDDKVLLWGGWSQSSGYINDTWVYDVSDNTWTQQFPTTAPSLRYRQAMASIFGTDKVLLFGGWDGSIKKNNETWIYDLSENTWIQMTPANHPSARYGHAMASICTTDKVLLFGGWDHSSRVFDTWTYDLSDNAWSNNTKAFKPTDRCYVDMSSVNGTDNIVLFGGNGLGSFLNDTWLYTHLISIFNGTHISQPYNFGSNSTLFNLSWNATISINTSIKFQLKTGPNESVLGSIPFVGPDGTISTFYNTSPSDIWSGHNYKGDGWIQYKAYFNTTNLNETPHLKDVNIIFNQWPGTELDKPANRSLSPNNKPNFSWNFLDMDSTQQIAFQVLISNNSTFDNVLYDSQEQSSIDHEWQFPNGTSYTELPDGAWYWKARTKDCDGDWGHYSEPWKIIIDSKAPYSTINQPVNNSYYNHLNSISGTAVDPIDGTGVGKVDIAIERQSDNAYWDGNSWMHLIVWLNASGTSKWKYDSSSITWGSGERYLIRSRAMDNASNMELIKPGNVFTIDLERPTTEIEYPLHGSWLNHLDVINGSAVDIGSAGVKSVEIYIKLKAGNDTYWNGSAWVNTKDKFFLEASGTTYWEYDTTSIPWTSYTRYIAGARAIDYVYNIGPPSVEIEFSIDLDKPVSTITYPANNTLLNSLDIISGSAKEDDSSGITTVEICITRNIDDKSWQDTNWELGEYWHTTTGTYLWSFDSKNVIWMDDLYYTIHSRATDLAGNVEEPYSVNIFMYDASPPFSSILINDGAKFTNSTSVMLSLEADDSGSGLDTVELSFDGAFWAPEESFNAAITKPYELSGPDGEKTVYLRVSDRSGNIAEPVFDSIILDTMPPEYLTIAINDDSKYTNNRQALLELNASDSLSGIRDVSYFIGDKWTPWEPFKQVRSFSLPKGDGKKNIVYRVRDNAENIAQASSSIILDTVPPFSLKISIIENASTRDQISITLKLTAFDNTSGVSQMAFSLNGENWSPWEAFSTTKFYELSAGGSSNTIYFRVNDRAGNIAEPETVGFPAIEGPSPTKPKTSSTLNLWNVLFIIIILIIILALAVFILKHKKTEKQEKMQELATQDAITVKPTEPFISISVKPEGELPMDDKTEQLPVSTTTDVDDTKVPERLATTTTVPGQPPEPKRIPKAPEKPQLPPAQTQAQPQPQVIAPGPQMVSVNEPLTPKAAVPPSFSTQPQEAVAQQQPSSNKAEKPKPQQQEDQS